MIASRASPSADNSAVAPRQTDALAPVVRPWCVHLRLRSLPNGRVRASPEPTCVGVVASVHGDSCRVEVHEHARIYATDFGRLVHQGVVCHAATRLAAPETEFSVTPDIRFERINTLDQVRTEVLLGEKVKGIGPQRSIPTADRAIAVQHPTRSQRQRDAHGPAMTSGSDHRVLHRTREPRDYNAKRTTSGCAQ